jgi:hypothetical protein
MLINLDNREKIEINLGVDKMLKKNLFKFAAMFMVGAMMISANPIKANAAWEIGSNSEMYDPNFTNWRYSDGGSYVEYGWKNINGKWYFFQGGYMNTGWIYENGESVYYCNKTTGEMVTGWNKIGDFWYYFYSNGKKAVNTKIDGYELSGEGLRIESTSTKKKIQGVWYVKDNGHYITITDKTYVGQPYRIIKDEGNICIIERNCGTYNEVYKIEVKSDNAIVTSLFNQLRGYYTAPYSCTRTK